MFLNKSKPPNLVLTFDEMFYVNRAIPLNIALLATREEKRLKCHLGFPACMPQIFISLYNIKAESK